MQKNQHHPPTRIRYTVGMSAAPHTFRPFYGAFAPTYFKDVQRAIREEIEQLPPKDILGSSEQQWVEHFVSKYSASPPGLDRDETVVDQVEVKVRPGTEERHWRSGFDPDYVLMTKTTFEVPITGDRDLLALQPPTRTRLLAGEVRGAVLTFEWTERSPDPDKLKQQFERQLGLAEGNVSSLTTSIKTYNSEVATLIPKLLAERRTKVEQDLTATNRLGYKLKSRPDAPSLIAAPVRKVVGRPVPKAGSPAEPGLEMEPYEDILRTCGSMSVTMERSPNMFAEMEEEEIRNLFLVALNAQFEGAATGETFNHQGKTDILIRVEDRNIFIAECKFWGGRKAFLAAVDQILGYLSWRDLKASILVFFRGRKFTKMLETASDAIPEHPNFVRRLEYANESGFRCVLRQRDDPDRELTLTVLAFHVPGSGDQVDAADAELP